MGASPSLLEQHPEGKTMRALCFDRHGAPEQVLKIDNVPLPSEVPDTELLVRVHAAAFNPIDGSRVAGKIKMLRPEQSFPAILGYDVAGVVEQVGAKVTGFSKGDEVVARPSGHMKFGCCSEYAVAEAKDFAKKPAGIAFTDAASLPLAGQTALQALRRGRVSPGDKVFISGGAGGVGSLAIQIAKHCLGASKVATTASPGEKTELCKSLGADLVINYHSESFEELLSDYDFALDTTGESHKMAQILKCGEGKHVITINGIPTQEAVNDVPTMQTGCVARTVLKVARNRKAERAARERGADWSYLFLQPSGQDMRQLLEWVDEGKVRPVIDNVWPFEQAKDAALRTFSGRSKGKCVVQIVDATKPTPESEWETEY